MQKVNDRLYNWATDIEQGTIDQALKTARLPIVNGHVALMPDAHAGFGSTVGSVIPTTDAIIPAAVGVDIGCGMIAVHTSLTAAQLPDDLDGYQPLVARAVPAGLGKWHAEATDAARAWFSANPPRDTLPDNLRKRALDQFGTLGSGNHFFEVCLDEDDEVFLVLHSGSRGVGNQLATMHIDVAKDLAGQLIERLEDPDLAYLLEGTPEFDAYIGDLLWSQAYAAANRDQMMDAALAAFFAWVGTGAERSRVNCHHNYTARETHNGVETWITRKGAIRAGTGDLGVIPGSMGTASYIVAGLGNPESYESCSHGAGRRMSRGQARRSLTAASLTEAMGPGRGRTATPTTWSTSTPRRTRTSTRSWPTRPTWCRWSTRCGRSSTTRGPTRGTGSGDTGRGEVRAWHRRVTRPSQHPGTSVVPPA